MKRIFAIIIFLGTSLPSLAQDKNEEKYVNDEPHYKLDVLGIRNVTTKTFNGLSLAIAVTPSYRETINGGLIGGIVGAGAKKENGFAFGGLYTSIDTMNGVIVYPGFGQFQLTRGIGLSLVQSCQKSQGVFLTIGGGASEYQGLLIAGLASGSKVFKGVSLSPLNLTQNLLGLQIGLYNQTKSAKGIQFGLINYIKENPIGLRILPIMNMRWADKVDD